MAAGFKVALEKSQFFLTTISFLEHVVTDKGLQPEPLKMAVVGDALVPTTITQVRAFLGLASYYRRFIKVFAATARPLTNLLRKDQPLIWTPECDQAFSKLKAAFISASVLIRPDPEKPFVLIMDWQPEAISAILAQVGLSGLESVVEYASKSVPACKRNYAAPTGECYAALWGISHFRAYLYGRKFTLVTDHEPLLALKKSKDYSGMIGRWATLLQSMDFDIRHRKYERHGNADGLTRLHRPEKVPRNEEVIPWNGPEQKIGPRYGQVEILSKQTSHVTTVAEFTSDLSSVNPLRHTAILASLHEWTEQVSNELITPIVQLADDLLPDIYFQSDNSPAPYIFERSLDPYLQRTSCLEEPRDEDTLPSRLEYLKPYEIIPYAFYPKAEEVVINDDYNEEDNNKETSEEGSYSEHREGEMSEEEKEEEGTGSEWGTPPEEVTRTGTEAEDPEVARRREQIASRKRQLEFVSKDSLRIDASQYSIAVVLQQDDDNDHRPVKFMSARLPSEKVAALTYERELYALRQALNHWKHYLLGRHFKVYSDHETLRWLKAHTKMTLKLTRWADAIDQFDFELKPVKGKYNVVADALSRRADYFGTIVQYLDIGADLQQKIRDAHAHDLIYRRTWDVEEGDSGGRRRRPRRMVMAEKEGDGGGGKEIGNERSAVVEND
ncbi:hypothetical protein CBR_g72667 [Chara braunii]|uniref:Reverse transcriptase RNase H-like domain-containing protein n=1 Tax=Chara braunii TaxID=69332 RepID=A0A388KA19_CHABU|nr:hypothetical protein CBR_g72667 [Chara braunii]|eukprot:GBG66912.1 hypothetical protein CBR_g72667 [Chara braunii]